MTAEKRFFFHRSQSGLSGREADIVDLGDGTVLRKFRTAGNPAREALVMEHARARGYPVPRVHEVRPDALVLERIDGRSMLRDLRRRPWRLPRHMRTLAELHAQLQKIDAPHELGDGALLHRDLHPNNVLLSPAGPVVIDWPNSTAGDRAFDVALAWIVCATSGGRSRGAYRVADRNVTDEERRAVERLLARELRRPGDRGAAFKSRS
jgi:aminoglycoside phosphotransferase (APT) family kinase protein